MCHGDHGELGENVTDELCEAIARALNPAIDFAHKRLIDGIKRISLCPPCSPWLTIFKR